MRSPVLLWSAIALVVVGLLGMAWLSVALPPPSAVNDRAGERSRGPRLGDRDTDRRDAPRDDAGADSADLGERIFRSGEGENGAIPRTAVGPGMMGGGCADCHGRDGRGRRIRLMMAEIDTPDIRMSTLTGPENKMTREDVGRAITDGVEPDGERLDEFMPRWRLSSSELQALLDYMEELDGS